MVGYWGDDLWGEALKERKSLAICYLPGQGIEAGGALEASNLGNESKFRLLQRERERTCHSLPRPAAASASAFARRSSVVSAIVKVGAPCSFAIRLDCRVRSFDGREGGILSRYKCVAYT